MDVLVAALALALGFVLGTGVGAGRAYRLAVARRAAAGSIAGFARLWPETMPERSAADILAGRIHVVLGNVPYDLPVLARGASRQWLESLDTQYQALGAALDEAGNDTPQILALLASQQAALLDMLLSYDETGVLPERAHLDEYATDAEILRAVIEVWRAANPLAATLAGTTDEGTSGIEPEPSSTPPTPTAGALTTSTSA
jgi:hypothetical protein